jgi:hypothetical protein
MRLEISVQAYLRSFIKQLGLPPGTTQAECAAMKQFRYQPPVLGMRCIVMNLLGQPRNEKPLEPRGYSAVYLGNIPIASKSPCLSLSLSVAHSWFSDDRLPVAPSPSSPWLEMLLVEDSRRKREAAGKSYRMRLFFSPSCRLTPTRRQHCRARGRYREGL